MDVPPRWGPPIKTAVVCIFPNFSRHSVRVKCSLRWPIKIADPYREYAANHPKTISPYRTKRGRKLLQRLSTTASGLSSNFVSSSFCFLFSLLLFFSFVFFAEASSFAGAFFASSLEEKFTEASTVFVSFPRPSHHHLEVVFACLITILYRFKSFSKKVFSSIWWFSIFRPAMWPTLYALLLLLLLLLLYK